MIRITRILCLVVLLCGLSIPAFAAGQTVQDLTGTHWNSSSESEKRAFLYGASSVVAIDQLLAGQQGTEPSPFVAGWMKAFGQYSLVQVQEKLDLWFDAHPEQLNRGVFDVLWYEFMVPALEQEPKGTGEAR